MFAGHQPVFPCCTPARTLDTVFSSWWSTLSTPSTTVDLTPLSARTANHGKFPAYKRICKFRLLPRLAEPLARALTRTPLIDPFLYIAQLSVFQSCHARWEGAFQPHINKTNRNFCLLTIKGFFQVELFIFFEMEIVTAALSQAKLMRRQRSCTLSPVSRSPSSPASPTSFSLIQGGRTWQAFGGGKNGHETFRQARIYNFRDKCVVFARNLNFFN